MFVPLPRLVLAVFECVAAQDGAGLALHNQAIVSCKASYSYGQQHHRHRCKPGTESHVSHALAVPKLTGTAVSGGEWTALESALGDGNMKFALLASATAWCCKALQGAC